MVAASRMNSGWGWGGDQKAQPTQGCRRVTPRYVRHVIICLNRLVNQCNELNGQSVKKKKNAQYRFYTVLVWNAKSVTEKCGPVPSRDILNSSN